MPTPPRRFWTRSLFWLGGLVGVALLISAAFQAAIVLVPGYRSTLEHEVSRALDHPVVMGRIALTWRWAQPMLEVRDIGLLAKDGNTRLLNLQSLRLGFSPLKLLQGQLVPDEVHLTGTALALERDAAGGLHLRGLAANGPPPSLPDISRALQRFKRIKVSDVSIALRDARTPGGNLAVVLRSGDLRLQSNGVELRAVLSAPGVLADSLRLRAGLAGNLNQPAQLSGQWTLDARNIQPGAALAARLPRLGQLHLEQAQLSASGDWHNGQPGEMSASVQADSLQLRNQPGTTLKDLSAELRYTPLPQGGTLSIRSLKLTGQHGTWPAASGRVDWQQPSAEALSLNTSADFVRLDDLAPWLALLPVAPDQASLLHSLRGELQGLEGRYLRQPTQPLRYALHARLLNVGAGSHAWAEGAMPGIDGINGDLSANESGGQLGLEIRNGQLVLAKAFSSAVKLEQLNLPLSWQQQGEQWQLSAPQFSVHIPGVSAQGKLGLKLGASSPRLDLDLSLAAPDATQLKYLMPRHWGEGLKHWLSRAIVRGAVSRGDLHIHGPLADFPYHERPSGDWSLDLAVAKARLEFHPDWPAIDPLEARLHFAGNGLSISAQKAVTQGVAVSNVSAAIPDFHQSVLTVDGNLATDAGLVYQYLSLSPVATHLSGLLLHTRGEGPIDASLHLRVPLHPGEEHTSVNGDVRLLGATLHVAALEAPVQAINGTLSYSEHGVAAPQLEGSYLGTALSASIEKQGGIDTVLARFPVHYTDPDAVARQYLPPWLLQAFSGSSVWRLSLPLSGGGPPVLSSDLRGLQSTLPEPLGKTADTPLPVSVALETGDALPLLLRIDAKDRLGLSLRFGREHGALVAKGLALKLGGGNAGAAAEDGLRVTGGIDNINLPGWGAALAAISKGSGNISLPLLGAQLSAKQLRLGGYAVDAVAINVGRGGDGGYNLGVSGPGASGNASLSADGSQLNAEFRQLALSPLPASDGPATSADGSNASSHALDPNHLPALEVRVDHFSLGGVDFGALNLSSQRREGGQTLNAATLAGGAAEVSASGNWLHSRSGSSAQADFTITSRDIAQVLQGLGFTATIAGKQALVKGSLAWKAPANSGLEWAQAQGKIKLAAEDGVLKTVEPGNAGRVLGLFNLYALPRRLTLDFKDVTSKGLAFDNIDGTFDLAQGTAHTDDLLIKGPSLKMAIHGNLGLANRTLDQQVTVTPNTQTVTLGALVLGGVGLAAAPALGVVALIANQVLNIPLAQATKLTYRVTGPWDNPEILRGSDASKDPKDTKEPKP